MTKFILTITGPSASGKSTLEKMLVNAGFERAISTTTRPMRDGEINDEHYHFVGYSNFIKMVQNDKMVENVTFAKHLYGLQAKDVEDCFSRGKPVVAVVEPGGRDQIRDYANKHGWKMLSVLVTNELDELLARFVRRDRNMDKFTMINRITNLIEEEIDWQNDYKWDVIVERFDESNQSDVVSFLTDYAESVMKHGMTTYKRT